MRQDLAEKNKLTSLADLSRQPPKQGVLTGWRLRRKRAPDALPAFEKAYGFNLNQNQAAVAGRGRR